MPIWCEWQCYEWFLALFWGNFKIYEYAMLKYTRVHPDNSLNPDAIVWLTRFRYDMQLFSQEANQIIVTLKKFAKKWMLQSYAIEKVLWSI